MGINMKMYNELSLLRQRLKEEGKNVQGRKPLVCTDEALRQIVELCPKRVSDFACVPGIGDSFIENYGEDFLNVIHKYNETVAEKAIQMSPSVAAILKELEKKLVRINRRNRLLYMPKLANKYAADLFGTNGNIFDILFDNKSAVTICDTLNAPEENRAEELAKYKKTVQLLREAKKDLREKGQNDLYVGYPFVIGCMPGEDFNIRAPLALFPVIAERDSSRIVLKIDEARDVLYNNTLLLAHYKFNGINEPLPSEDIEEIKRHSFVKDLLMHYQNHGITINGQISPSPIKFCEYKADEFPKFTPGELYLENCIVLGKYPVCENSIHKDFEDILKNNEINTLVNNLIADAEENEGSQENEIKLDDKSLSINENSLLYINDLNSSQEAVLAAMDFRDELVVQGPPGTGKSQVITSLISDFVSADKTVLMVSEKKTALDVVYSRLGNLSKYALIIDDVGNKDLFYKQLQRMVNLERIAPSDMVKLNETSTKINGLVKRLEKIADVLYTCDDFGIEPYKLYQKNRKIDFTNQEESQKASIINSKISLVVSNMTYPILEKIYQKFSDVSLSKNLEEYASVLEKYPWISSMKHDIAYSNLTILESKLNEIKKDIDEREESNVFVKIFAKVKIFRKINDVLKEYFKLKNKELRNLIFNKIDDVIASIKLYVRYQELKSIYDRFSEEEISYYDVILNIKKSLNYTLVDANNDLFNQLLYKKIEEFEVKHRELFQEVNDFDSIIQELNVAIGSKQEMTKRKLEEILSSEISEIPSSKRCGEILRVLDSKRKWSVNKFIQKFNFELFRSVKIWLLTPEVVSEIIPLQTGVFDLVIFDEASQMFVEKGIPSILRAKKVVIAGDHKQLRPSNLGAGRIEIDEDSLDEDEEVSAAIEEESLLDLARFKYKDVMLNFHYRSKYEELIAFSNHAFYNGRLYVSPNIVESELPPIEVHKIENAMWTKRANLEEAKYIVEMLKKFFEERTGDETIGIITFNISQRELIEDLIDEECAKSPEFAFNVQTEMERKKDGQDIGLFVKNIESVQGDERDVVIFSIGYAKNENGKLIRNFGWLNQRGGENRLNVAISRAKQKIHIVTSIEPAELLVDDVKNDGPRYLKKYLEYAFAVSNNDKRYEESILNSLSENIKLATNDVDENKLVHELYDVLLSKGFEVDKYVGIGGYKIDLAIKKNGNYVLGIECDGKLYNVSKSARERDFHRQKYLESRGWKIYRMWSTNWWRDPAHEIEKICALADIL
ncbi:MAG: HRDC domain-containing protein [Clostridia bacterium]|nr:HRDC domain-containing protein [Clostridia bacterium]